MAELIDELKKQITFLEEKLSMYEDEQLEKQGYFAYKKYVRQQIEVLSTFKLKDEIIKNPKDDKYYDRVKAIGEGIQEMILGLKNLKSELKIGVNEDKNDSTPFIETVAETRK